MNFKILFKHGDDNDATHEYVNIIEKAAEKAFDINGIMRTYSPSNIKKDDIVIVISPQAILKSLLFIKKEQRFIYWFQGIVPEEVMFLYPGVRSRIKYTIFGKAERFATQRADFLFFVSEKLKEHCRTKYEYNKDNHLIMPCFNKQINESSFSTDKYSKPSFVYAGSLFKWQCIDETIQLFSEIKTVIPNATLTILTKEIEKAELLLQKYRVHAEVKYIPQQKLDTELSKYKYGFLLRDKMLINEVATPTKMNSYMAAGVIPIYSNVIGDFTKIFNGKKFFISSKLNDTTDTIKQILDIERNRIDGKNIFNEYAQIFDTYYNQNLYIEEAARKLKKFIK